MDTSQSPHTDRLDQLLEGLTSLPQLEPPGSFIAACDSMQIACETDDISRFGRYLAMIQHVNQHVNLTAVNDTNEMWIKHILDSLSLLPILQTLSPQRVIDVGSGAGLPGIPLAIALPDIQVTLLEATKKKTRFLETAASILGLHNVCVINERAETLGQDHHHREKYDVVTARALGPLPVLLELILPLTKVSGGVGEMCGGWGVAIKGEHAAEEIQKSKQALHLLHARVSDTIQTPTGTIIVIEKVRPTPRKYPRRPGEPKHSPLGQ